MILISILKPLLYPIAILYGAIVWLRNKLYDAGFISSIQFSVPVISVGNLSTGGTGKTPHIEYLIRLLQYEYRVATMSRGYKRKTTGFYLANAGTDARMIGDEPMQLFERFRNRFVIGVCEDRVYGAKKIIEDMDLQVLLLDDSYQHRAINPGMNLLLTDYNDPYFKDFILPAGDLRESRHGMSRADIIIVTKCPDDLTEEKKQYYISRIRPQHYQKVFFSAISYDENIMGIDSIMPVKNLDYYDVLLITGIANPSQLLKEISKYNKKVKHLQYKDHHNFTDDDIKKISSEYKKLGEYKVILTTEKDYVRLKSFDYLRNKIFYWPINVEIDKREEFNQIIQNYVRKV